MLRTCQRNIKKYACLSLIVIIPILVLFLFDLCAERALSLTASLIMTVESDAPYFVEHNGGRSSRRITPAKEAFIASGSHDADFVHAFFKNGIMRAHLDYGPTTIKGSFPMSTMYTYTDAGQPVSDWDFTISLFNTSSGRKFHVYLNVMMQSDITDATAQLYIFYEGSANPAIINWEGQVGEDIHFVVEI